ncbi:MAG TPA: glycosyltransferase [bacterium]|nr:glycosyltransferase [bacterium]
MPEEPPKGDEPVPSENPAPTPEPPSASEPSEPDAPPAPLSSGEPKPSAEAEAPATPAPEATPLPQVSAAAPEEKPPAPEPEVVAPPKIPRPRRPKAKKVSPDSAALSPSAENEPVNPGPPLPEPKPKRKKPVPMAKKPNPVVLSIDHGQASETLGFFLGQKPKPAPRKGAKAKSKGAARTRSPRKKLRRILPAPEETRDFTPPPGGYLPLPSPRETKEAPTFSLLRKLEWQFEKALDEPKVSVVVVNYDGVDFLWNCLFALKTQSYPPYEIILVDNGSKDASVSFVKSNYRQVQVLECQDNFGFAMGGNLGVKYATGDLVVIINNDTVVTPDWLARLVEDFQEHWPKVGALASAVKSKQGVEQDRPEDRWTLNILGNPVEGFYEDGRAVFYPEGCALMYPRFLATEGPFDPDYFIYGEDVYWGWRIRLMGKQVRRAPDARVFHEPGGTTSRFHGWRIIYYKTRNRWMNLFLFYETRNLLKVLPWWGMETVGRLVTSLWRGFDQFLGTLLALGWLAFHPRVLYRKRLALQEKRKAGDSQILRYLSGRVMADKGHFSRVVNFLSLAYCLVVGLEVLEFPPEK